VVNPSRVTLLGRCWSDLRGNPTSATNGRAYFSASIEKQFLRPFFFLCRTTISTKRPMTLRGSAETRRDPDHQCRKRVRPIEDHSYYLINLVSRNKYNLTCSKTWQSLCIILGPWFKHERFRIMCKSHRVCGVCGRLLIWLSFIVAFSNLKF